MSYDAHHVAMGKLGLASVYIKHQVILNNKTTSAQ